MPHIHTKPNQHDMTVSGYIVRLDKDEPRCLVHLHRKMGKLMQIGGHIELDQTPWQAVADEVSQESGYDLSELRVAQHSAERMVETVAISHPTPFTMNTHDVGNLHYHSDLCYGFVAQNGPQQAIAAGESSDLRWLTIAELDAAVERGEALADTTEIYRFFVATLGSYALIAADTFSLDKPTVPTVTYKFGAPGEPLE